MKRNYYVVLLSLFSISVMYGQVEFEFSYPSGDVYRTVFPFTGERYVWRDAQPGIYEFYNEDHQLEEVIDAKVEGADLLSVNLISEGVYSNEAGLYTVATYFANGSVQQRILGPNQETVFMKEGGGFLSPIPASGDSYFLTYFENDNVGNGSDLEVYSIPDFDLLSVIPNALSPLRRVVLNDGNILFYLLNSLNQILLFDINLSPAGIVSLDVPPDHFVILQEAYQTLFDDDASVEFIVGFYDFNTAGFQTQVLDQSGNIEFATDSYLVVYGDEEYGFSFITPTLDGTTGDVLSLDVYAAKNFVYETSYLSEGLLTFVPQIFEQTGKGILLMREENLRVEQYNASHELIRSFEPNIVPGLNQDPSIINASEGRLGTDGLECLIGFFGPTDVEETYLVDEEGNPYFDRGFGEFTFASFLPGADPVLIGTDALSPTEEFTNVYRVDLINNVSEPERPDIQVLLSPNPTTETIQVYVPHGNPGQNERIPFSIQSLDGKVIEEGMIEGFQEQQLSVGDLPTGTYLLSMRIGETQVGRTFVKR